MSTKPAPQPHRFLLSGVTLGLCLLTGLTYCQVAGLEFVTFDDPVHVYENPHVRTGLTWNNLQWDFGIHGPSQWHPLAWLSHQLDCELFGLRPAGHHVTNLVLHTASVLLLFHALVRMTGRLWPSAFVAAVFAVHPLNVESVAWVAERRNVLSGVFWMLTLLAYCHYTRRAGVWRYLLVLVSYSLGLMSKPMLVTLPCVLLLLDFWPLGRFRRWPLPAEDSAAAEISSATPHAATFLLLEKLPLFGLSAVSIILSYLCQQHAGAVATLNAVPLHLRAANALVAYVAYLRKMAWPTGLAAFYPHPALAGGDVHAAIVEPALGAAVLLLAITAGAVWTLRRWPYLAVGWSWYLGTLTPVIGLVQVGDQQFADRYAYIPLIGVFIAATWLIADVTSARGRWSSMLPGCAVACLAALVICTRVQVNVWQNSIILFSHALSVTSRNKLAHNNLATALRSSGRTEEAIAHLRSAIAIDSGYALAYYNLSVCLYDRGDLRESIPLLERSLSLDPEHAPAWDRMGTLWGQRGRIDKAVACFERALRVDPEFVGARLNLGIALSRSGREREGLQELRAAIQLDPDLEDDAWNGLGWGLLSAGKIDEACQQFTAALKFNPELAEAHYGLALALLRKGEAARAREHLRRALTIRPDYPEAARLLNQGAADDTP